jgi:hypothetical protein
VLINNNLKDKRGIREKEKKRETRHNMFTISLVQSVMSLDSIATNTDFIEFE